MSNPSSFFCGQIPLRVGAHPYTVRVCSSACLPSGKCLQSCGKSPYLISTSPLHGSFSISHVTNYQRAHPVRLNKTLYVVKARLKPASTISQVQCVWTTCSPLNPLVYHHLSYSIRPFWGYATCSEIPISKHDCPSNPVCPRINSPSNKPLGSFNKHHLEQGKAPCQ